ncbi:hypothetical protein VNO77_34361 [Canavalia gladiata]|uniref:Uncharacterized protein n=1 Tax=Canavalia gladiata TaxID=3824 RepID=A0AAN9PYG7_CANGL
MGVVEPTKNDVEEFVTLCRLLDASLSINHVHCLKSILVVKEEESARPKARLAARLLLKTEEPSTSQDMFK